MATDLALSESVVYGLGAGMGLLVALGLGTWAWLRARRNPNKPDRTYYGRRPDYAAFEQWRNQQHQGA